MWEILSLEQNVKNQSKKYLFITFLLSFIFIQCKPSSHGEEKYPFAPEFPLTQWIFYEPVRLSDLKGKIVLLDFWTYSCINCIHAIEEVKHLEEKWKNELVVLGIHSGKFPNEHNLQSLKNAVLRNKITHPVANDSNFQIWDLYGISAWPSFVLIDPQGRIVARKVGEGVFAVFDKLIENLVLSSDIKQILKQEKVSIQKKSFERTKNTYLYFPSKITISPSGRELFISNSGANNILVVHTQTGSILEEIGEVEGFEDGNFQNAKFSNPQGLYYKNENLFLTDAKNHAIRKIDLISKQVSTLVRSDENLRNPPRSPWDISSLGSDLLVAMAGNHQIWVLDSKNNFKPYIGSGQEELGDENSKNARLAQTSGITVYENKIYFLDSETSSLRVYDPQEDKVTTLVGKGLFQFGDIDGKKDSALMQHPLGITAENQKIFIADTYNHKIKYYDLNSKNLISLAGTGKPELKDGEFTKASFNEPSGLVYLNQKLYVADTNNHTIRVLDLKTQKVETLEIFYSEKLAMEKLNTINTAEIFLPKEEISSSVKNIVFKWELGEGLLWRGKNSFVKFSSKNQKIFFIDSKKYFPFQPEMLIPVQLSNGETNLEILALLDYCQKENPKICMTEKVRFLKRYKVKSFGNLKNTFTISIPSN